MRALKTHMYMRISVGIFAITAWAVACGTSSAEPQDTHVDAGFDAGSTLDTGTLPALDAAAELPDAPADALAPIPEGCDEMQVRSVSNGTMLSSGPFYSRHNVGGVQARLVVSDSPWPEFPLTSGYLVLDRSLSRPTPTSPVILPLTDPNQRTSKHFVMLRFATAQGANASLISIGGSVTLTDVVNDEQFAGYADNLRFTQVEFSREDNVTSSTRVVPGTKVCVFIRHFEFDTRMPKGCDPDKIFSCGAGQTCMAVNLGASDGFCVKSNATLADGAPCTADPLSGDSNCAVGSVCRTTGPLKEHPAKCLKRCDMYSSSNTCGANQICDVYGVCVPTNETWDGNNYHPEIAIGSECGIYDGWTPTTSSRCGSPGGPPAHCFDADYMNSGPSLCVPYVRARPECNSIAGWGPGTWSSPSEYVHDISLTHCTPEKPVRWLQSADAGAADASTADASP